MASRFFAASDSSSDESSEEELYSNDEESEQEDSDKDSDDDSDDDDSSDSGSETGANRFLKDADSESESDDEDVNKVLKSAKDKRFDELEATIRLIENAQKINDWAVISEQFDKLIRQVPTLTKQNDGKIPKLYIQAVADLETVVVETHEKQKVTPKKMNAVNGRGFNAVRQKIKKHNRDYEKDINAYRENKEEFMREEEEVIQAPKEKKKNKIPQLGTEVVDEATDDGFITVGAGGKAVLYTPEGILKHLRAIVEQRGRKNSDKLEHIRTLEKLFDVAINDYQKVRVLLTLISTRFDLTSGTASHMHQDQWKLADQEFGKLLQILENSEEIVVIENAEEWEDDEKLPTITPGEIFRIPGSIVSFVERLDDELTRSLQHIDPHTSEYIERLTDEALLYAQLVRTLVYVESMKKNPALDLPQEPLNRIVMRRLEHVYFKPSQVITILENNVWKAIPESLDSEITPRAISNDTASLVQTLCTYLFQNSEGIIRARAMLCQIYFLSLHDQYYKARDMMLMSHLQETISNFDVNTQILFNRALVQVGLCAFRAGLVYEAQTSLQEICGSNRQKELLAQGLQMQRYSQISPEQERLERQRQLPFHMHINLELLECVYLTCSMLLEIPLLAQLGSSPDLRKRVISKTYRRLLEYHERQIFTGPPENTRDHVMQASKALSAGEWKKAAEFINSIKIWELMANSEKIKEMLSSQIQEEGLRTYLFTYAPFYDTLAISTLAGMFELSERKVSAVVSKMISHEELAAALDQVNSAIIFRKGVELSRLQTLALSLSDKASGLIESNEKTLEQRTQGTANAFERQGGRGNRGGRGGGRGGGGRGGGGPRGGRNQQFTGGALGRAIQA
ncbi:eukaryotic translation initiation factor 3 subunit C [Pyrenophora tritici-repentis]|uniref:Eukaryotic translation initiation factor 3 subunit C n=1 Tax=Pyrenophora tritici-repentis TaxID=45151 RepID=A0A2W1E770_9PLEO|nr:Eukaryotic translation initiation factor 3 protein [Pyrenophora tritici-repentis]KAG9379372.1 Eukaryotic translation initiation factor 3 protein [Pyrenophora tritici-repentis]KAI0578521.1 Eukaryotic translation initiation factor 3 subunit C [Pyrenophora tritici-repentis]KAI0583618.1 Eukaryotic translation initiation factor 3 subunit C [Pyrenophora tritici-repentis]KAI0610358.1 Eukaryotic translation initiation factor 3 subunit C [Pyrenophora tritici-repentis]